MAARTVPGAADRPARRVVPGAPPPPPSKAANKSKGASKHIDTAVKVPDATSAALMEKAPENPKQVANGLKVTRQDLAEQAEAEAAVAAVNAVQPSSASTADTTRATTPAQKVIHDRILELSSKAGNATITVAVDELKSLLNKVQQAESTAGNHPSSTPANADNKARLVLLLQFLHLFNLFHPNPAGPSTFAPSRTMPPALEMSTGQQVAALAKVFDQLANGPLEGGGGDALETLASIEAGSKQEVLPDVSFATIREMILKMTAPPSAAAHGIKSNAISGLDSPPKDFVPVGKASPSAAPVSFIQASEVLDGSKAEPEGGQPSTVPSTGTTVTSKGEQGGAGTVFGDKEASGKADGTAASAVKSPINTTIQGPSEPKLNWAALAEEDDDDLGEAPIFEPLPSSTTSALVTPAPGTPTAVENEAGAATSQPAKAGETPLSPKPKKGKQNTGAKGVAGARNGNGNANGKVPASKAPAPKAAPKVDEDGFILQESKRTKYLQQKQQQQQRGGGGRGGTKGGANTGRGAGGGGGGKGHAGGARGPKNSDGRPSNSNTAKIGAQ